MTKTVDGVTHTYLYAGGKLLRESYGNTTLDFFYGANGNPFALKLDEEIYYYITNLQGDVLFIVDAEGNTVAAYTYDPYGNPLTATGTLANTNPLRYRGYYYDTETGFYYLQSRYYDPTVCRFINADGYASTGQGILGHNMFAYCGNNPIAFEDSGGGMRKPCTVYLNDGAGGSIGPIGTISSADIQKIREWGTAPHQRASKQAECISSGINNTIDFVTNTDAQKVIEAQYAALYNGKLFIKFEFMDKSAFSFGIVLIGTNAKEISLVQHEYGHLVHQSQIGSLSYLAKVAVPSVISYWSNQNNPYYFSQPWEFIADKLGDVDPSSRDYLPFADTLGSLYYLYTLLNGPF